MKYATMLAVLAALVVGLATTGASAKKKAPAAEAPEATAAPINAKCPMSKKGVNVKCTTEVAVSFCCGKCQGKFDKNPAAFMKKVAAAEDGKCPMSGRDANPEKTTKVSVAFCCGKCRTKFGEDPKANLAKIKPAGKKKPAA